MIAGIFHKGSGLGDQLMRYITVRTLAEEKGFDWGMLATANFKGTSFLPTPLDALNSTYSKWIEKDVRDEFGNDIRSYDPEINFVEDSTIIDGCFEDYKYWGHNIENIRNWLKVEPLPLPSDVCVISHRGGEYKAFPELYLPDGYWMHAIKKMREVNPLIDFEVQTDDKEEARRIFPDFEVISNIGYNWRAIRYAKYLIVSNSAFSIIPSLLGNAKLILAPKYHARHNIGIWARPASYYKRYQYIDKRDYT